MNLSIAVNLISVSFFAAIVFTGFLRTLAKRYKFLIDLPDKNRKFHKRPTPLVGGLGIHMSMLMGLIILFFSVDTMIYDQSNLLITVNSSLEVENDDTFEKYKVSASRIDSDLNASDTFKVTIDGVGTSIIITRNSAGNFELISPNGELKEYAFENGYLKDLNQEKVIRVNTPSSGSYFSLSSTMIAVIVMSILLQLFMILDDVSGLSQKNRFLIQSLASVGVIALSGEYINNIGFGLFGWNGELGYFGVIFTIFAVTGMINAFNMIDGINGLCSGIALICLLALIFVGGSSTLNYGILIAASSIIGFLIYNLGLFGKKRAVFLGDNGSNLLGFLVAWTCIYYSSEPINLMSPVTALWFVAIPLWDCIHLIIQRSYSGKGAFEGSRDHIHHIVFDRTPLSGYWPLISILFASAILCFVGIYLESIQKPIYSIIAFIIFGLFFTFVKQKMSVRAYSQK